MTWGWFFISVILFTWSFETNVASFEKRSVDSIKRVELTSSASAALKVTVNEQAMTALSRARTVGEVVQVFCEQVGGNSASIPLPSMSSAAVQTPAKSAPAQTPAKSNGTISSDQVVKVMLQLLSATTGFTEDMITNDLSLEDDLGLVFVASLFRLFDRLMPCNLLIIELIPSSALS